jgi:hypothetical protein
MKVGIIGLGSMGRRRIRNLKTLGGMDIWGFDTRPDRRDQSAPSGIHLLDSLEQAPSWDAVLICTPPHQHEPYLKWCLEKRIPCFMELSLLVEDLPRLNDLAKSISVPIVPSCTLFFHPAVQLIRTLISSGEYGKITNFSYHSGQYLPDWHPWENVKDFFVGRKDTSGCKELLAFEINWISRTLGIPQALTAWGKKSLSLGLDSSDTYGIQVAFDSFMGVLLIDVVSRYATRSLILNFEKAQLRWNWEEKCVRIYRAETQQWITQEASPGPAEPGYNPNISETMYVAELRSALSAMQQKASFPADLDSEIRNLKLIEKASREAEAMGAGV